MTSLVPFAMMVLHQGSICLFNEFLDSHQVNKLIVSFLCVCPVIDHKFRHHIVKVAVDPRGDSRVDPQTTLTM